MLNEHDRERLRILLGRRIRALRKGRHLTQEQLAFQIGTSRSFLSRVEHGTRALSIDELNEISEVFMLSVSELLTGVELSEYRVIKTYGNETPYNEMYSNVFL